MHNAGWDRAVTPWGHRAGAAVLAAAAMAFATSAEDADTPANAEEVARFGTQVMTQADAAREDAEWGVAYQYYAGASWGTEDMLSGVAEIKPGMEIHPPHVHAEEEYLMVTQGTGVWSVNGEEFPANPGDMLYSAPWDEHGIRNTGDETLTFVFWKWRSSGLAIPPQPDAAAE